MSKKPSAKAVRIFKRDDYQTSFRMGSGEKGAEIAALLNDCISRLGLDITSTLRVAVRVLAALPKEHPEIKKAAAQEG